VHWSPKDFYHLSPRPLGCIFSNKEERRRGETGGRGKKYENY